jgi:hypothetical protein
MKWEDDYVPWNQKSKEWKSQLTEIQTGYLLDTSITIMPIHSLYTHTVLLCFTISKNKILKNCMSYQQPYNLIIKDQSYTLKSSYPNNVWEINCPTCKIQLHCHVDKVYKSLWVKVQVSILRLTSLCNSGIWLQHLPNQWTKVHQ